MKRGVMTTIAVLNSSSDGKVGGDLQSNYYSLVVVVKVMKSAY